MKYILSASAAALLLALQAIATGGLNYLLMWPALSLITVAGAYSGIGAGVFGKRADGTMRPFNRLLMLPFCIPYELAWKLYLSKQEPAWHLITPGLWLGRRVRAEELPNGVGLVVDVTAEFESFKTVRENYTYWTLPTLDARTASTEKFKELSERIAAWSQSGVYIHCAKGRGRSTTLLVAVLLERNHVQSIDEAMNLIRSHRPQVRLHKPQRKVLESLYERANT
ncbi:MAG: hypothetical protein HOI23_05850 [Deltaproteobacteria bacterium]|jgi:protein-tyrosine phosphatase|nr:hypothetical protein [Deltaproteobacteria bacterium]MBT6436351.1 hypothetical protein [Deltaproteobacteria bacterium]